MALMLSFAFALIPVRLARLWDDDTRLNCSLDSVEIVNLSLLQNFKVDVGLVKL